MGGSDVFKNLTGVSANEFDRLQWEVAPVWAEGERKRLSRPDRQRAIGGGRDYTLDLKEQLLMTLVWLYLSLNTEALGFFFGVDKSTASRNTRRVLTALGQLGETPSGWPEPPKRGQGKNIEQALRAYPDLLAIVNETEQTSQFPGHPAQQKAHYPGQLINRTKQSTIPVQLITETPPFQGLSSSELQVVSQAAHLRHVERHTFFFHQGDPATTFYILVEGQVRLTEVTPEGHQVLVRFISPGEAIGYAYTYTLVSGYYRPDAFLSSGFENGVHRETAYKLNPLHLQNFRYGSYTLHLMFLLSCRS